MLLVFYVLRGGADDFVKTALNHKYNRIITISAIIALSVFGFCACIFTGNIDNQMYAELCHSKDMLYTKPPFHARNVIFCKDRLEELHMIYMEPRNR